MQAASLLRLIRRLLSSLEELASKAAVRLFVYAVIAAAFVWPALGAGDGMNLFRDAQVLTLYERVAVEAVRSGDLPLWNPFYCGGMYALGSPQSRFASPPFLLSLLFGADRAQPLIAFLMVLVGLEGFYRYARDRVGASLGPAVLAPVFALQGFFATLIPHGWIGFYSFQLLPWLLLGVRLTARERPAGVALVGGSFAWMIGFGGSYAVILGALAAVGEGLASFWPVTRSRTEQLSRAGWLGFAAVIAVAMCAFRLWPIAETLRAAPRLMLGTPGHSATELLQLVEEQVSSRGGNLTLTGLFFVPLPCLVAVIVGVSRRQMLALLGFGLSVWAAAGYAPDPSLFAGLRGLPVLEDLRYPERFLVLAVLFASVLAAHGCTRLIRAAEGRAWVSIPALVAVAAAAAASYYLTDNHASAVAGIRWDAPPPEASQPFRQARGNRWLASYWAPLNRGSLQCWEAYPVPMSDALRADLPQEESLLRPGVGRVRRMHWSPNRMELSVHLEEPTRLRINQNHHPGWRANVGEVVSDEGLLAVDLPAGSHVLRLRFLPRSAMGGALVSLAAVLALLGLGTRRLRWPPWQRMTGGLGLVGVASLAAFALPEPSSPQPVPRNADGTPAVARQVSCPPAPSVRFPLPVSLVGACIPSRTEPGEVVVELDWRVTGDVPWSVGVFLHFERRGGGFASADHHAIGTSFTFADAPQGVVLRDRAGVFLSRPGTWDVWAGLWHVAGNGTRIAPVEGGAQERIHLGVIEVR